MSFEYNRLIFCKLTVVFTVNSKLLLLLGPSFFERRAFKVAAEPRTDCEGLLSGLEHVMKVTTDKQAQSPSAFTLIVATRSKRHL